MKKVLNRKGSNMRIRFSKQKVQNYKKLTKYRFQKQSRALTHWLTDGKLKAVNFAATQLFCPINQ